MSMTQTIGYFNSIHIFFVFEKKLNIEFSLFASIKRDAAARVRRDRSHCRTPCRTACTHRHRQRQLVAAAAVDEALLRSESSAMMTSPLSLGRASSEAERRRPVLIGE